MKKHKVWALVMLGLIIVLPLITWWVMVKGADVRRAAKQSAIYKPSTISISPYLFVSQRGDTISDKTMQDRVCVFEFFTEDCYNTRFAGTHPFFSLQEDYYGKTLSLRFISVDLSDSLKNNIELQRYSGRYAAREMWHVVGGDVQNANAIFQTCIQYAANNNIQVENKSCSEYVFLADRVGNLCGVYNIKDSIQFNALYQDILFTIDKK